MGVSPQQVNKRVKGSENFTIETLIRLGDVLGIDIIQVRSNQEHRTNALDTITSSLVYEPKEEDAN